MTDRPGPEIGGILMKASYLKGEAAIEGGFAGVFARIAQQYFQAHGDQSEALARIAAKNHRNGCANPWAQLRKDLGYEFCREVSEKNPRSEEHTSELQSLMRISYAVLCLKKKNINTTNYYNNNTPDHQQNTNTKQHNKTTN